MKGGVGKMAGKREKVLVAVIFLSLAICLVDIIFTFIFRDFMMDVYGLGAIQRLLYAWSGQVNLFYRVVLDHSYRINYLLYLDFIRLFNLIAALANGLSHFLGLLLAVMILRRWRHERP